MVVHTRSRRSVASMLECIRRVRSRHIGTRAASLSRSNIDHCFSRLCLSSWPSCLNRVALLVTCPFPSFLVAFPVIFAPQGKRKTRLDLYTFELTYNTWCTRSRLLSL